MSKPYIPNDRLAQKARKEDYRARSVYKLKELDHKFNIIKPQMKILDIAAAPGSWSQYASEKIKENGHILSVDIQVIEPIASNVTTAVCDIFDIKNVQDEFNKLGWDKVDLILSDIAPSTTGVAEIDHGRSIDLNTQIFEVSKLYLKPNGKLVLKVFDGKLMNEFIQKLSKHFKKVVRYKSTASRERSKEIYVICS